jgi:hypothetical protein
VISTTIRLNKKMTRLLIIIVLSLTLLAAIIKQEELLINETELPTSQADTTESRLDQQSDDPNTNSANNHKQKKI